MWQVVGHEKAVGLLDRSLKNGKLAHAYLFIGPPHVGKMRLAIDLAKALNCPGEDRPCGHCAQCVRIEELKHADVQVIGLDGRAEIGIDQMREMQHSASLKPFEGKYRVFIVDGAEHLSHEATNCLLKTLEEPPSNVQLILLALNERGLLPTVLSRCQKLELRPLPIATFPKILAERWGIPDERAKALAKLSRGCVGWAVSALTDDQLIQERSERLDSLLRLTEEELAERFSHAAQLASQFSRDRQSVYEVLSLWIEWWHDLLLTKVGCANFISNVDQEAKLHEESQRYGLKEIKVFIESLQQSMAQLEQNANPRLVLEVLMISIPRRKGERVL